MPLHEAADYGDRSYSERRSDGDEVRRRAGATGVAAHGDHRRMLGRPVGDRKHASVDAIQHHFEVYC